MVYPNKLIAVGLCGVQNYTNMDRPKGSMHERVDIAVDALCTLCIGVDSLQHSPMGCTV